MSSDELRIRSHAGEYGVVFGDAAHAALIQPPPPGTHVLIDERVARLHSTTLEPVLAADSVLRIAATEDQKSLERIPHFIEMLQAAGIRRGHTLFCVGGGILQDIACFIAAVLFRGLPWRFVPTTLLAQADSCIGSKSSINVGSAKNIVGTYTPPTDVYVWPGFLDTLERREIRSGIGEMLKVHAINGPATFDEIARDYSALFDDRETLLRHVRRSLAIKQTLIESDEFDRGPRNVLNYGHSFGHAIEAATGFGIPHGIAITIGMDLANFVAGTLGRTPFATYERMHPTLRANYAGYESYPVDVAELLQALRKDKKNSDTGLRLVLPDADATIRVVTQPADANLTSAMTAYLDQQRTT